MFAQLIFSIGTLFMKVPYCCILIFHKENGNSDIHCTIYIHFLKIIVFENLKFFDDSIVLELE